MLCGVIRAPQITVRSIRRSTGLRRSSTKSRHDPLRILFCGADEFSIYSLHALRQLRERRKDVIQTIDVVCRPDKRVGRGLKQLREVPIKAVAKEMDLSLHQIDTFRGWSPPNPVDLVVAVSFGLLVPSRILTAAKYGGLNIHPSLLPELRGPAPIHHALLQEKESTGVSLQTMHPTRFDHGIVLSQVPANIAPGETSDGLIQQLGPLGAKLLATGIESGEFLFSGDLANAKSSQPSRRASYAPKLTPEDRHIDWTTWSKKDIEVRDRVLGRLWDVVTYSKCMCENDGSDQPKRMTYEGPWQFSRLDANGNIAGTPWPIHRGFSGVPRDTADDDYPATDIGISTVDGDLAIPFSVTVEGERKGGVSRKLLQNLTKKRDVLC